MNFSSTNRFFFSTGLLKVGRTLYVGTNLFTAAFDAATCQLRWRYTIELTGNVGTANNRGAAVKRREDTHRMADANKAFSHYRW